MPHDLKLMLEQMMAESPDYGTERVPGKDLDALAAKGYKVDRLNIVSPWRNAVAFTIDKKTGQLVYKTTEEHAYASYQAATHEGIQWSIEAFQMEDNKAEHVVLGPRGDLGIVRDLRNPKVDLTWFLNVTDRDKLIKLANGFAWKNKDSRGGFGVTGRMWPGESYISFWNKRADAIKHKDTFFELMKKFDMNPVKCLFQFSDQNKVYTYEELDSNDTSPRRSDAEIRDLMKQQHVDPNAKKKLAAIQKVRQLKSPGFDFQAQRDAMMPAVAEAASGSLDEFDYDVPDGVPYLHPSLQEIARGILREDPDHMIAMSSDIEKLRKNGFGELVKGGAEFTDWNSTAIFFDQNEKRVLYGVTDELGGYATHKNMMKQIDMFRHHRENFEIVEVDGNFGLQATKKAERKLVVYPKGFIYGVGFKSKQDFEVYLDFAEWTREPYHREQTNMILGRYWEGCEAVSFWNTRTEVMKHFDIVKMFFTPSRVDKIVYQFIDSDRIYLFSELNEAPGNHENLTPADIAALRRKQHIDPAAKKKLAAIDKVNQVVSPGFEFQAQRNAAMPAVAEAIVTEDPNRIHVGPGQTTTLGVKGADVTAIKRAYFDSPGTISFIYDRVNNVMMFNQATSFYQTPITHPDMGEQIMAYLAYPDRYEISQAPVKGTVLSPSLEYEGGGPGEAQGEIFFPSISTEDNLKKYLVRLGNIMPMDGSIPRNSKSFLMGRLWTKEKVMSFWGKKADVMKHISAMENLIASRGLKPQNILFEFLDDVHLFSYDELQNGSVQTRSSAEQQALMAQQHLKKDDAARKNWKMKNDPGFEFQAKKNAAMPALQESPDTVYDTHGARIAGYNDGSSALAFLATANYSTMEFGATHYGMIKFLKKIFEVRHEHDAYLQGEDIMSRFDARGGRFSDVRKVVEDIQDENGFLGEFYLRNEENAQPNIRTEVEEGNNDFILGRVWPKQKLLSFWNDQHTVLTQWSWVQKMFLENKQTLGNLREYKVDFLEREEPDASGKYPDLTPASDIGKTDDSDQPLNDTNGQLNMIAQLFNKVQELPKLADDKLKKIREKLHVLDPALKAQVAKMLNHAGQHKAAAIAGKLGMSTAEFNHLWNVNEGTIKLRDLIQ